MNNEVGQDCDGKADDGVLESFFGRSVLGLIAKGGKHHIASFDDVAEGDKSGDG